MLRWPWKYFKCRKNGTWQVKQRISIEFDKNWTLFSFLWKCFSSSTRLFKHMVQLSKVGEKGGLSSACRSWQRLHLFFTREGFAFFTSLIGITSRLSQMLNKFSWQLFFSEGWTVAGYQHSSLFSFEWIFGRPSQCFGRLLLSTRPPVFV